jgi:hypothetical protein
MPFVCPVGRKRVKLDFLLKLISEINFTAIYLFGSIRY